MDNTRTALIEMMRDYQHKEIDYFVSDASFPYRRFYDGN